MSEIASHKIFNLPQQILPVTYQILSQISFSEHSSHNNNKWVIFVYTRTCILLFIPPSLLSDVEKLWNSYRPHHMNLISIFIVLILHIRILRWPRFDSYLLYFSETLMTFCRAFWLIVSHVFFLLYLVVFRQGDIGTNWYIVLSGSLEVLVSETGDHKVNQLSSYHWLSLRRANRLRVLFYCV